LHGEKRDLTDIFSKVEHSEIFKVLQQGGKVGGIMLERFAGVLNYKTQPDKVFADEIAGRLKVIACLDKYPNLFHSDDIGCAGLPYDVCDAIKDRFGMRHTDAVVITWGSEMDVNTALAEIKIRAIEATEGIPNETRQHINNGITDFERILPGADRMYPDTDSPPVAITKERLAKLKADLPEPSYTRDQRWKELGLSDELIHSLGRSRYALMFNRMLSKNMVDPKFLAYLFESYLKNMKRNGNDINFITDDLLSEIFKLVGNRSLPKDAVYIVLDHLSQNGREVNLNELFDKLNLNALSDDDVTKLVDEALTSINDTKFKSDSDKVAYLIGQVKTKTIGRYPSQKLAQLIKQKNT